MFGVFAIDEPGSTVPALYATLGLRVAIFYLHLYDFPYNKLNHLWAAYAFFNSSCIVTQPSIRLFFIHNSPCNTVKCLRNGGVVSKGDAQGNLEP